MTKDGALEYGEFCINAYRLVQISDIMNDQWRLHGSEDVPGSLYLVKQQRWGGEEHVYPQCLQGEAPHQWGMDVVAAGAVRDLSARTWPEGRASAESPHRTPRDSPPPDARRTSGLRDESRGGRASSAEQLDRTTANDISDRSEFWEYHVVYSQSYCVPVLYFRCWDAAGNPLSLTDVWRYVSPNFQGRIAADKWSLLTQQEHPVLKRPFYCLHPCNTKDILNCIENSWNPIILWLSAVGPTVGLKICPFYCPQLVVTSAT